MNASKAFLVNNGGGGGGVSGSILGFGCEQLNIAAEQHMRAWNAPTPTGRISSVGIKVPRGGTLKRLRVYVGGATSTTGTFRFTVRLNTVPTLLTVDIPALGTDGAISVDVAVAEGDLLQLHVEMVVGEGVQAPGDVIASLNFE